MGIYHAHWAAYQRKTRRDVLRLLLLFVPGLPLAALRSYIDCPRCGSRLGILQDEA